MSSEKADEGAVGEPALLIGAALAPINCRRVQSILRTHVASPARRGEVESRLSPGAGFLVHRASVSRATGHWLSSQGHPSVRLIGISAIYCACIVDIRSLTEAMGTSPRRGPK